MLIQFLMLVVFFGLMLCIGLYCRKRATDVNGFVLGGRNVGPWLTAFAYGTSYLSDMQVSSVGNTASRQRGQVSAMPYWVHFWHGLFSADGQEL